MKYAMNRPTSFFVALVLVACAAPLLFPAGVNGQSGAASQPADQSSPALPLTYYPVDQRADFSTSLNGTWKFKLGSTDSDYAKPGYDDNSWQPIQVPGNWDLQGFEAPAY